MQEFEELEEELNEVAGDGYHEVENVSIEEYPMDDFGCAEVTITGEFVNLDGVRTHLMNSDDWYCASCAFTSSVGELRIVIDRTKKHSIEREAQE